MRWLKTGDGNRPIALAADVGSIEPELAVPALYGEIAAEMQVCRLEQLAVGYIPCLLALLIVGTQGTSEREAAQPYIV